MPQAVSPVGKAEILEGFPPAEHAMTGEPMLRELIRVLIPHAMQHVPLHRPESTQLTFSCPQG